MEADKGERKEEWEGATESGKRGGEKSNHSIKGSEEVVPRVNCEENIPGAGKKRKQQPEAWTTSTLHYYY